MAAASVRTSPQSLEYTLPVSHWTDRLASLISALTIRNVMPALSAAFMPIPTRISRGADMCPFQLRNLTGG